VIGEVRADVGSGLILSRALGRHPKVFNRLFVAMVSAGESSGTLDTVLDRIATQIEKDTKLKRRVKSAMVYPTVVITFASIVLVFMLMFIVPVFQSVFAQLNGQLPAPTQIVVDMSHLLRNWWYIIFPLIGLAIWSLRRFKRTPQGTQWWDQFKLRVPMKIGDVVHKIALARLSRTLATLVAAGVDIITALDIAGSTAGNWVVEQSMIKTSERVHDGVPISVPLADDPIFPPMVSQMVKIGEETGELDKMLSKIADFYEDEVDASIAALTSIIEPLMMIGVGAMVGTIVIAMYLPMFKLLTLIK
jgi:type IV pilus assembly protein PilC